MSLFPLPTLYTLLDLIFRDLHADDPSDLTLESLKHLTGLYLAHTEGDIRYRTLEYLMRGVVI